MSSNTYIIVYHDEKSFDGPDFNAYIGPYNLQEAKEELVKMMHRHDPGSFVMDPDGMFVERSHDDWGNGSDGSVYMMIGELNTL